ncbi:hypothetical protein [Parapedobacter soli]|uniref:hypothetical protein n=1 Tax=Parapedobacter soli TaxID=416955 RepID=UPI0021C88C83|nr:hypothetical protein [Parapedobacter soli]
MKTILKTLLVFSVVLATSCKKGGDPEPTEPEPRAASEFLNLSYDEQIKYSEEYLKKFFGKKYRYSGRQVSEVDENGLPTGKDSKDHIQEGTTACEKAYIIHTPNGFGVDDKVTVSVDTEWAEEYGCPVVEFPYSKNFHLHNNTSNGLPISVNFPDIKLWVSDLQDESGFQVLAFPFLDTYMSSIVLLKYDGEYWQMYSFSEVVN